MIFLNKILLTVINLILFPQKRYDEELVAIRGADMSGSKFFPATRAGGQCLHRLLCLNRAV